MTNTPRNPQAYPSGDHLGMTLRDHFAAKFMQGFIAGAMSDGTQWNQSNDELSVSKLAYSMADAMLKAREED